MIIKIFKLFITFEHLPFFLKIKPIFPVSRGVIFTPARVLLALLSLRKNGGLLVV